jgi:hypothetical protein
LQLGAEAGAAAARPIAPKAMIVEERILRRVVVVVKLVED